MKDFENGGKENKLDGAILISRKHDDTQNKLEEYEQNDLKIGLKVFVNKDDEFYPLESVEKGKFESFVKNIRWLYNIWGEKGRR